MRVTGFTTFWLCMLVAMTPLQSSAQQQPAPAVQGTGDDQPQQPAATPNPAPASVNPAVNPKTGLPFTPDEMREKEIDKYDPLKPDPTAPTDATGTATPLTDRKQPNAVADPSGKPAPIPGSVAASDRAASASGAKTGQNSTQASTQDSDTSEGGDSAGYAGPAVLTRSYTLARPLDSTPVKWTGGAGFSYSWNDGRAPGLVDGTTGFVSAKSSAVGLNWNLSGRHLWKRDQLGLTYTGNYSQYFAQNAFVNLSGINNSLNLDYSHIFTRHLSFHVVESVQVLSQNYPLENPALQPGGNVANINLATSPNIQLLNNTVRQSSTQASVTYRQTARLSYDASASYFIVGQTEPGLIGNRGQQFGGDLNYRWTSRATVGAYYSFTDYNYSHGVSHAASNGAGLIYSYAINRHMQLRTRAGLTQIKSRAYESVILPPELAAILGQSSSIVNASSNFSTTDVSVQLVRDFGKTRTASVAFARGESPGNGLLLTSVQETATAGFSSRFFRRRLPVNVGVTYSSLAATLQANLGDLKSESVYFSTSRPLGHNISANFSVNYSRYSVSGSTLTQDNLSISLGLGWSPRLDRILPF